MLTAGAALLALDQRGRARSQTQAAEAQRLAAQAVNADTLDFSLLLARQGVALDDGPQTEAGLLAALRRSPAAVGVMRPGLSSLAAVALPRGSGTLAVTDFNGAVAFMDPATRRRLALHRPTPGTLGGPLASAPDGSRVAVAAYDANGGGFIELFDPRTRRHVAQLGFDLYWSEVESAVFTPDSKQLLLQVNDSQSGNEILVVDARTGRLVPGQTVARGIVVGRPMPGDSRLLGFAGSQLVTWSPRKRTAVVRDAATLRAERTLPFPGAVAELSPALGVIAFGGRDGSMRLLDVHTGRMRTAEGRHNAPVTALAFSDDGRTLVTAGSDEQLLVWDTRRAALTEALRARGAGFIDGLAVTSDRATAYSAGRDGTVVAWDLEGGRRLERPLLVNGSSFGGSRLVPSPRGARFAIVDRQGSIDVLDSRTLAAAGRIPLVGRRRPQGAAISPDGRTLAVTDLAGRLRFWDLRRREALGEPVYAHAGGAQAVTFSGDGRWLVTGGEDQIVRLWDARRHTARNSFNLFGAMDLSLNLNPQGTLLAVTLVVADAGATLQLVSVPDLEIVRSVRAPPGTVARFTPDGRSLLYGDREGRMWIYDTRTWKPSARPLFVSSPLVTADISPDGRQLATTSINGEARLWDIASGRAIGGVLPSARGDLTGAAFIDGGRRMAVLHERGGYAWNLDPAAWARHACSVAGRTLTSAEWESALPGRRYAPACTGR